MWCVGDGLQLLPSDASVLTNYGHLLFELRRNYSGAEQAYRQALRVDPQVGFKV